MSLAEGKGCLSEKGADSEARYELMVRRAETWWERSVMLGTAVEERPAEAMEGRLLQKLASESRPGTGVDRCCHGSAVLVGVGGGGRRSGARDSVARRRAAALIFGD